MKNKTEATLIETRDKTLVVIKGLSFDTQLVTVEGNYRGSIAEGIAKMINESQCFKCGKFNGLHGEIFYGHSVAGTGSVEGHYEMCPHAKGVR
jgi:hypothetical protein